MSAEDVSRNLKAIAKAKASAGAAALYQEGLGIQRVSMGRTPVDTGVLRGSHVTSKPVPDGDGFKVTVSVGGPAASYALLVHERTWVHHPVGQAKFLVTALYEALPGLAERIAARVKKAG